MGLLERTQAWRREFLARAALDGSARILCWGLTALALALWADRLFSLPQTARLALFFLGVGGAAAAAHVLLLRPWLRFDWRPVLDGACREFPELKEYLSPAWEFLRGPADRNTSADLRAAHLQRTEKLVRALPRRKVFPWRPDRAARRGALAALLAGVSLPWLGTGASWERVLAPWRDVPLERFVRVSPGDAVVDWGASAVLSAEWEPGSPAARDSQDLRLWLKGPEGWKTSPWDRATGRGVAYEVAELSAPLQYRLSWRDLQSRSYRLTPVPVPQLDSLQAKVFGHGRETLAVLGSAEPLSVLRGSWVTVTGRPNQPLAKAALRLSSLPVPVAMRLLPKGEYEGGFSVSEDAVLRLDLETPDGRRDPHPVAYAVKAVADQPPKIELLSPLMPLQASPADTIPIAYSASDDAGLSRISLLIGAAGRLKEVPLLKFAKSPLDHLGDVSLDLSKLGRGKFEFQLKAVDNGQVPQSALSEKGSVEIVDFESGHAVMEADWLAAERELGELAAREEKVKDALARRAAGPLSPEEQARLEADSAQLPEDWKQASESLSELSQSMQNDAYANPGLSEQARALSEEMKQAQSRELPAALEAAKKGDFEKAGQQHKRLSSVVKKSQRLLSEGKKLQGLEDFFTEAGRMSQTGSELQASLESLANSPDGPTTEEKRKLDGALEKLQKQMESLQKTLEGLPKAKPQSAEDKSRRSYSVPLQDARDSADALKKALAKGDYAAAAQIARELSEQLSRIQKGLSQAASDAAQSAGGGSPESVQRAQAHWSQVVEEQTKALEQAQRVDEKRVGRVLQAQKDLLEDLAREQGLLVSSAAARADAFPQGALAEMRAVLNEFEARKVVAAAGLLQRASAGLRASAPAFADRAAAYEWFAAAEDAVRARLEQGPPPPPNKADADSESAAGRQSEVRAQTGALQQEVEAAAEDSGAIPREAVEKLEGAQSEQRQAEDALRAGDSSEGVRHEQSALSLLQQGDDQMSSGAGGQKSISESMGEPFLRPMPGGVRTTSGGEGNSRARLGAVPLPRASDYRAPKEIREELQKSLKESRPAVYDGLIKEYFKRIAQ